METKFSISVSLLALATAIVLPFAVPSISLATEILILAIAVCGCNLLLGLAGLLSFGQGIPFGVGAYAAGLLITAAKVGLVAAMLGGAFAAAIVSFGIGYFAIRRQGVYFVMLTLAFAQMAYFLMLALRDYTGGENGLTGVQRPPLEILGHRISSLDSSLSFYALVAVLFVVVFLALQRFIASPLGSVLIAIRESEGRASAIGYNTFWFKIAAFVASGAVTGLAGALYAIFIGFVPPTAIEVDMSQRLIVMSFIGGTNSLFGAVLGSAFYSIFSEGLSEIWPRWLMLIGVLIIAVVLFLRGGLWGGVDVIVRRLVQARGSNA
jgi:branched-chain amino acid transport system permease protein